MSFVVKAYKPIEVYDFHLTGTADYEIEGKSPKDINFDEFQNALRRMSEAAVLLQRFEDKQEAVSYLVNETGLPVEECDRAYDIYIKMFSP